MRHKKAIIIIGGVLFICAGIMALLPFFKPKRFSLAYTENTPTVRRMAESLVYELNGISFKKDAFEGKKVDVYVTHFVSEAIPAIKDKAHYNILWLGSKKHLNIANIEAFDAIFISTPDLAKTLNIYDIESHILFPFATGKKRRGKCAGRFFDKDCHFVIIGGQPEVKQVLEEKSIAYKSYSAPDDKTMQKILADAMFISGAAVGNALFFDNGLDISPLFAELIMRKIPLLTNNRFVVFSNDKNYLLAIFNDTVNYYTYMSDLYDFFEKPHLAQQRAEEAFDFVNARFVARKAAEQVLANLLEKDLPPIFNKKSIGIVSPTFPGMYNNGDYWIARDLQEEFTQDGFKSQISFFSSIVRDTGYVNIYIRGGAKISIDKPNMDRISIMYILFPWLEDEKKVDLMAGKHFIGMLSEEFLSMDAVACASLRLTKALKNAGVNAYYIPQFTNTLKFYPDYDKKLKSEILFVGNNAFYRKAAQIMLNHGLPITIYGTKWGGRETAPYIDNRILRKYYASAKIVLNDTREGMKRMGFVINRIFDITASGGFVISDYMKEIEEIYGDTIPMWKTEDELVALVEYYLEPLHEEERKDKARRAREITLKYFTADKAAEKFLEIIHDVKRAKKID